MQYSGRIGHPEELPDLLEGQRPTQAQGIHHLKSPIIQGGLVEVIRIRCQLQLGLGCQPHARGQCSQGDFAWTTTVVAGHPVPEPECLLRNQRGFIEQGQVIVRPVAWSIGVHPAHDRRVQPLPAQGNDHPAAGLDGCSILLRHPVGQQPGQGQRQDDIDIHHERRMYPNRSLPAQLAHTVEPHLHISVSKTCTI